MTPGTIVAGRYAVLRALGEGGMGQVYEVQHRALGRRFALKVLRADLVNAVLVRRFEREAQSLARVSTARVAQVTDFGIDPSLGPFYVMELLDGETLGDRLDREGRLSVAESAEIAIEIAEALVEVHAASIVHRDLKPSNVGLPVKGPVKAKLLDFGLAAVLEGGNPRLTKSQELLGSLPYMAPEQFMGEPPTPAIDLYALGVCTYEMLTGRLPFDADSSAALMRQILMQPVPPLDDPKFGVSIPGPLAAVVLRLLGREPRERYPSAQAAAQALRAASVGPSRDKTLKESGDAAMPQTRGVVARADALAATEESPSIPPPEAAEAATLLVAAAVMSTEMPVDETWRSGPPAEVSAAGGPRPHDTRGTAPARAERRVPSTSEVPAAIRTTSIDVAGMGGGRRAVLWLGALVTVAAVVALVAWLSQATRGSQARGNPVPLADEAPVPAVAAPAPVVAPAPLPVTPVLPEGVAPPAPEPAAPAAVMPVVGEAPGAPAPRRTPARRRASSRGGQWSGEVIDEP